MMWDTIEEINGANTDVMKFIFKQEDAIAEAVLYKYPTFEERTVMCISTQTGCPMGCSFCGTGKFFGRNLKAEEIIAQVYYMVNTYKLDLNASKRVQIMFMSMGEPLLNMNSVAIAIEALHITYPKAALLISTSGPDTLGWNLFMEQAAAIPTLGLQFSVHESTDQARNKLIPMKHKMNLKQIAAMGLRFHEVSGRRPFFNYCVHPGNATDGDIKRLTALFDPTIWEATLSVICEKDETNADAVARHLDLVQDFSGRLVAQGFNTRVFNPAGQDDIGGGCGQLWQVQKFAAEHPEIMKQSPGDKIRVRQAN